MLVRVLRPRGLRIGVSGCCTVAAEIPCHTSISQGPVCIALPLNRGVFHVAVASLCLRLLTLRVHQACVESHLGGVESVLQRCGLPLQPGSRNVRGRLATTGGSIVRICVFVELWVVFGV